MSRQLEHGHVPKGGQISMHIWLSLALSAPVVRRASYSALIVGTVLILINHGAALLRGEMDGLRLSQMALTVLVPYGVSTVSSVITILEMKSNSL